MPTYPDLHKFYPLTTFAAAVQLAQQIEDTPQWHVTSMTEGTMTDEKFWLIDAEYRDILKDGREGALYPFQHIRSPADFTTICKKIQHKGIINAYATWS